MSPTATQLADIARLPVITPFHAFAVIDGALCRLGRFGGHMVWHAPLATAVAEFVARHQTRKVTERLDAVYSAEPSALEPELKEAQRRRLPRDMW